jgi:8-oxo-dGTP diphosphatase
MRFQVVSAAYVFLRRSEDGVDEVLLQLREGTGYMDGHWAAAAAGHVEAGESVLDAAVREAAEELGIGIAADDLVPLCAMHRTLAPHAPVDERVDFFTFGFDD